MKKFFLILVCILNLNAADATMEAVNRGQTLPKIIVQNVSSDFSDTATNSKMSKILIGDLKVIASFEVVGNLDFSNGNHNTDLVKSSKADFVLQYWLSNQNGGLVLNTKLISTKNSNIKFDRSFSETDTAKWPFLAHKAIKSVIKNLNLPSVDWLDKYILIAQYTSPGKSNIMIADYTLNYTKNVITGGLNIFPKWANNNYSAFYYTTYTQNTMPTLYRFDLNTGKKTRLLSSTGMIVASDVSKDGNKLLLTMAPEEQSDIYLYDTRTRHLTKITNYKGIDTNGNFVDNERGVVFISDRLGYPNIFRTDINGGDIEQMVDHSRNNNSVTTFGNYVVYASREHSGEYSEKTFNLYLISTKSSYIRQLTINGVNTFPRFSRDGGSIIYIKNLSNQRSAVGIIRLNENKSFQFPLRIGKLQSIDW